MWNLWLTYDRIYSHEHQAIITDTIIPSIGNSIDAIYILAAVLVLHPKIYSNPMFTRAALLVVLVTAAFWPTHWAYRLRFVRTKPPPATTSASVLHEDRRVGMDVAVPPLLAPVCCGAVHMGVMEGTPRPDQARPINKWILNHTRGWMKITNYV